MFGWEVTREDVENVLKANGKTVASFGGDEFDFDVFVDGCVDCIDCGAVEKSAMCGDDMSEQIDYANLSIYEQLVEAGKL